MNIKDNVKKVFTNAENQNGEHLEDCTDIKINNLNIDIGEHCTHCNKDTSLGSGLFVSRIPSDAEAELILNDEKFNVTVEGYMCYDCQLEYLDYLWV